MTNTPKRFIPTDLKNDPVTSKYAIVYRGLGSTPGHYRAMGFIGKSSKHAFNFGFPSKKDMDGYLTTWLAKIDDTMTARADAKAKLAAARNAPSTLKVGDILSVSWGYDQTNVNFYQVIKTIGKRTVHIREIASKVVDDNGPTTHVVAVKDAFLTPRDGQSANDTYGRVMTKRVSNGRVKVYEFASASLWDGRPMYETGMGYGH